MSDAASGNDEYKDGDLVWAKIKGCPSWPGKVTEPTENTKKPTNKDSRWIFFFGINDYAWVNVGRLKPYHDFKNYYLFRCRTANFLEACNAIETYIFNLKERIPKIFRRMPSLKKDFIAASNLTFGFIGLGNIGSEIVTLMLYSGHKVIIWNRTSDKTRIFEEAGATIASTPSEVMEHADITFSCVTDPKAVKEIVSGSNGILTTVKVGKAYVEMTSVDPDTSMNVANSIRAKDGLYLEAMIQGSKIEAENGNLVILAAGNGTVLNNCESVFRAISKNVFNLGDEVGKACKMNLILHSIKAVSLAGLAEGMALLHKSELSHQQFLDLLKSTSLNSPLFTEQGNDMMNNRYLPNRTLSLLYKDIINMVGMSHAMEQPCPILATVHEVLKQFNLLGYGDMDVSSLYHCTRYR